MFTGAISHAGCQRAGLAVGRTAGNDEAIKEPRNVGCIEDLDVLRFDVFKSVYDQALQFLNIHGVTIPCDVKRKGHEKAHFVKYIARKQPRPSRRWETGRASRRESGCQSG